MVISNLSILFVAAHYSSRSHHYSLFHTVDKEYTFGSLLNQQKNLLEAAKTFDVEDIGKELLSKMVALYNPSKLMNGVNKMKKREFHDAIRRLGKSL